MLFVGVPLYICGINYKIMAKSPGLNENGHLNYSGEGNGNPEMPSGGILNKVMEFAKENPIAVILMGLVALGIVMPGKKN